MRNITFLALLIALVATQAASPACCSAQTTEATDSPIAATPTVARSDTQPNQRKARKKRKRRKERKQRRYKHLRAGAHVQTRLWHESGDASTPSAQLRRARFNGTWKHGRWRLNFKLAFEESKARLLNGYFGFRPNKHLDVEIGQFKRITNLDYIIGSYEQRLWERSVIGNKIDAFRDIGVGVRSKWLKGRIDGQIAMFNGNGAGTEGNDDTDLRYEARLDLHLGKVVKLERWRIGRKPRAMIGFGAGTRAFDNSTTNSKGTKLWTRARRTTMALTVILQGWRHEVRGEWLQRQQEASDPITGPEAPDASLTKVARDGGFVQWAWQLPTSVDVQTSARAQVYRPTGEGGEQRVQLDFGASWQLLRKIAKLSLHGYTMQSSTAGVAKDRVWGALMQLQFRI